MYSISSRVVRPWFRRSVFESAPPTFAVPRKGNACLQIKQKATRVKRQSRQILLQACWFANLKGLFQANAMVPVNQIKFNKFTNLLYRCDY